ncbi:MAG: glutathione S-transferase [Pseudomonadota bacterium]
MTPVLYSFRRCPYAMRARIAIRAAGTPVYLREIVLRNKPEAFLEASESATVPCLVTTDGVLDESLEIMEWALAERDPEGWLDMPDECREWIARADGPFKHALDRTKYATRYPDEDPVRHRVDAAAFLAALNARIGAQPGGWLFGRATLADMAILPFVRQFAFIDKDWFDAQPWPDLQDWLARFLASEAFTAIMDKYPAWKPGDPPTRFG